MKIYVITSDHSEIPLAEIRTSGNVVDFIVDNTNGYLPGRCGKDFTKLQAFIQKSSHLQMTEPKQATVNLLRYVMDNGDVVEITSDGHTILLNGELLAPEEKDALLQAIKRGDIKVARKTNVSEAIPVIPTPKPSPPPPVKLGLTPDILKMIRDEQDKEKASKEMASRDYDEELESASLHDAEDPAWTRRMLYWLRYGDKT